VSALVEGFQVAYYGGIALMFVGAIVLLAVPRTGDVAEVDPDAQPVAVGA
jgi:hypothetical protein